MSSTMSDRHHVLARITEQVEPIERGDRYEDPLDAFLSEHKLGQVTGGGSQLSETGEIEFADIEIELVNLDDALIMVVKKLEAMGAPFGSSIQFASEDGRAPLAFGTYEQLTIYLDAVGLPDDVYDALDFDELSGELSARVERDASGQARSVWTGDTETALHLAGPSADALEHVVRAMWKTTPVFQNARLVLRYADGRASVEKRLPMHVASPGAG
jgi:hypothetical protein